jgi:hypothetical protein
LEQAAQILKCMLRFDKKAFFLARWKFNNYRGYIIEARTLRKEQAVACRTIPVDMSPK